MKSLLIIGGGIVGLSTAYYAMQKGHSVTLVERGSADYDCCSLGNAGMITPSHFVPLAAPGMVSMGLRMLPDPESPFAIRPRLDRDLVDWCWKFMRAGTEANVERAAPLMRDLCLASRRCYEELAQTGLDFGLTQKGLMMLCKSDETLQKEAKLVKKACELGLSAELLSPEQAARLDPNIRMEIAGAAYFAQDCHLTPRRLLAGLTRELQSGGVTFRFNTQVTGWDARKETVEAVHTTQGDLTADEVVIAGGAWSPDIVKPLDLRLPMQAGKGYNLTLSKPRQLPSICSILTEARVAVTPMGDALRFAGTMEITGLDLSINPSRVRGIIKSIPQYFPEFQQEDFRDVPVWSGLRPCSPDGLPYIGRFRKYSNLLVAAGHAMMGLTLGPISGRLIAEVLSNEPPSLPLTLLSPDRYA